MPLSEKTPTEHPMALYAATKKANKMMAHSSSHLFDLPTTGLRFFTVYGLRGRPDMALFLFAKSIREDCPFNVFNHGKMIRDFTYEGDIVESNRRLVVKPATGKPDWSGDDPEIPSSSASYHVFNIGNGSPLQLMRYIKALETAFGKKGKYNMMDIHPGDVPSTHADTSALENYTGFRPNTCVEEGVANFIEWYIEFYNVKI
jgi:UDP-glucuronate 4-epimerase